MVLDDADLPVAVLDFVGNALDAGPLADVKAAALEEAGIGYVTANELTAPDDIWTQVFAHLYLEDDDMPQSKPSGIAV